MKRVAVFFGALAIAMGFFSGSVFGEELKIRRINGPTEIRVGKVASIFLSDEYGNVPFLSEGQSSILGDWIIDYTSWDSSPELRLREDADNNLYTESFIFMTPGVCSINFRTHPELILDIEITE